MLGIHRWPVKSPHIGRWRGALMFCLICANNREVGDLRRHRARYGVTVMGELCSISGVHVVLLVKNTIAHITCLDIPPNSKMFRQIQMCFWDVYIVFRTLNVSATSKVFSQISNYLCNLCIFEVDERSCENIWVVKHLKVVGTCKSCGNYRKTERCSYLGPFQYLITCLIVRSREVSKPRYW